MAEDARSVPLPGSTRAPVVSGKQLQKTDPAEVIRLSIYVRRNPKGHARAVTAFDELSTALPAQRHYLNDAEFEAAYGADPGDMERVVRWAQASKLHVVEQNARKRRIIVEGSVHDVEAAFKTTLHDYENERGRFRARQDALHVPASLADVIRGVFGLDTRPLGRPRRRRGPGPAVDWRDVVARARTTPARARILTAAAAAKHWPRAFFPPQIAQLYGYPAALDGTGQNIAVFAFNSDRSTGGYNPDALKIYFADVLGMAMPDITDVRVHGVGNSPGPDRSQFDATGEVMLDLCVVGAVAPGAKIFVYFSTFTSRGWVDAIHDAISDDNGISVISISYGNPEDDPQGNWTKMAVHNVNTALEAAVARGVTVFAASGDDGSGDAASDKAAHVDFPASSPYVLGVGGTKLVAKRGASPSIASETVWNEVHISDGAGGGGVSAIFSKPPYQVSANVPPSANPPHRIGRGVPDVSAVADPQTGVVVMHVNGKHLEPIGGTSASAPLWAGLIARINQGIKARSGFLNELLYTRFAHGVLRDITLGNNGAYKAEPGWDACTGLGSPDGGRLLNALSGSPARRKAPRKKAAPRKAAGRKAAARTAVRQR